MANITTPLLGMVDVAVTGHLGKAAYLAAIAVGGSMFNMLYWLFGFLRMGSSGMPAQAYGADDRRATDLILYRALLVAFIAGAIIIALQTPISGIVLRFMDPDPDTLGFATRYFEICVWGAPAVLGTYALGGWFLGMQNSRAQMWMSIVINLANIAVSLTLVYGFRLTIEGVATGTMTAQWLGLVTGLLICRRYRPTGRSWSEIADMRQLQRFFAVNTDIFLRTVCLVAVTVWFTRAGAQQGTVMLAVNALLMQLFMLFSFFMDGFAFAGEALCGRDVGRHDIGGLRRSIKALFSWGAGLALLFTAIPDRRPMVSVLNERRRSCGGIRWRIPMVGGNHPDSRICRIHMGRRIHRSHPHPMDAHIHGRSHRPLFRRLPRTVPIAPQPRPVACLHSLSRCPRTRPEHPRPTSVHEFVKSVLFANFAENY